MQKLGPGIVETNPRSKKKLEEKQHKRNKEKIFKNLGAIFVQSWY